MGVSTKRSLFSSAKDPATHHAVPRRSLLEKQYPTLATDEFAQILFDLFFTQEVDKPIWYEQPTLQIYLKLLRQGHVQGARRLGQACRV